MTSNISANFANLFVAEWSPQQKQFHVEPFNRMVERNLRNCISGSQVDYYPVAICSTAEEAHDVCLATEKLFDQKKNIS